MKLATSLIKNSRLWQFRIGTTEELRGQATLSKPFAIRTNRLRNTALQCVEFGLWALCAGALIVGSLLAL